MLNSHATRSQYIYSELEMLTVEQVKTEIIELETCIGLLTFKVKDCDNVNDYDLVLEELTVRKTQRQIIKDLYDL